MEKTQHMPPAADEQALAASTKQPRNPWAMDAVEYDPLHASILMRFPGGIGLTLPVASIDELAMVADSEVCAVSAASADNAAKITTKSIA